MKNIQLEVSGDIYQNVIDFLSLLPKEQCHLIAEEELSNAEESHISELIGKIKGGDDSEFDNWDEIKSSFIMKPRRLGWRFFNRTFIAQCVGLRKDVA